MNPLLKTALLRFIAFSLLTSLSAWLFVFVEYTGKNEVHEKYQSLRSLYESMAWKYNMSINEFNNFSNAVYEAMSVPAPVWTYHNAMDFVLQAVTTIGYGSVTPKTATGQVMCILVCLVGIPISMLSIKSVGEVFALWFMAIIQKFEKKVLKRQEPKGLETKSAVILFSLMILFVFGNGLILVSLKGWTLLEGVYFWFVTLTTIGFGDYLMREPAQRITHLEMNGSIAHDADGGNESLGFKIVMSFFSLIYLVLSLCLVSSVLNSVIAALENHNFQPRCQRCIPHGTPNQTSLDRKREPAERDETNMASLNMENHGFQKENTTPLRKGSVLIQSTQLSDIN